jgi:hypothetical protein
MRLVQRLNSYHFVFATHAGALARARLPTRGQILFDSTAVSCKQCLACMPTAVTVFACMSATRWYRLCFVLCSQQASIVALCGQQAGNLVLFSELA